MGGGGGSAGQVGQGPLCKGGRQSEKDVVLLQSPSPARPRDSTKKGQEDLDEDSSRKDAAHSGPPQALETYTRHLSGQPALAKVCFHPFLDSVSIEKEVVEYLLSGGHTAQGWGHNSDQGRDWPCQWGFWFGNYSDRGWALGKGGGMMAKGGGHQGWGRNPARGLCGGSQGRDAACLRGSVFPAEGEGPVRPQNAPGSRGPATGTGGGGER